MNLENKASDWKNQLNQVYSSRGFNIFMDVVRIATIIILVLSMFYLYQEIETVKFLNSDPCKVCMEANPGCNCFCFDNQFYSDEINITDDG